MAARADIYFVDVRVKLNFVFLVANRKNPQHVLVDCIFALTHQQEAPSLVKDSIALTGIFFWNSVHLPVAQCPTHLCRTTGSLLPFGIYWISGVQSIAYMNKHFY